MLQPQGTGDVVQEDKATVTLKVRVADAQGLRLQKGGEIRLKITLRSTPDREGLRFGAKVTPWQDVPENAAPIWKGREAEWNLPADVCYEAEFIDSASLVIELMQRGHEADAKAPPQGAAGGWPALGSQSFGAALQKSALGQRGLTAIRGGALAKLAGSLERSPDIIGTLRLPLGKRLVCPAEFMGGGEGAQWVQLLDGPDGSVKGTLLLELIVVVSLNVGPASVVSQVEAAPAAVSAGTSMSSPRNELDTDSDSDSVDSDSSEHTDDQRAGDSDAAPSQVSTQTTSTTQGDLSIGREPNSPALPVPERKAAVAVEEEEADESPYDIKARLAQSGVESMRASSWWLRADPNEEHRVGSARFDDAGNDAVNIFTINHAATTSALQRLRRMFARVSRKRLLRSKRLDAKWRSFRSMLDPETRQNRQAVRRWRQWHEVFCTLNEIGKELTETCALLSQAAMSMRRFGESHTALQDCVRLSAFMHDAMLYVQSEADIPRRVEDHLTMLQGCADEFRSMVVQPPVQSPSGLENSEQKEPWVVLEDLQIDLAVILESAIMTAQQALAEYKRLHCRLELLVSEYESICRAQLESDQVYMPLLVEEGSSQPVACMPEQAVEWSVDFSSRIGAESRGLEMLVRDLEQRSRQVKNLCTGLRNQTLHCMATTGKVQE
mmetsp:Transcript_12228/g.27709  ORF Transcript_12228/g.27709 Transcript_12228/m.27709 type:complete len:666 (+) Transcript_12228:65-2062(+)